MMVGKEASGEPSPCVGSLPVSLGQCWQKLLSLTKCQEGTGSNSADSEQLFWWHPQGMGRLQSEILPFSTQK